MSTQDKGSKRQELNAKAAKLSAAKQALLERMLRRESPLQAQPRRASQINRVPREGDLPVTFFLQAKLEEFQRDPQVTQETPLSRCVRLSGAFDETAIKQTINELARRHEILRTRFALREGQGVQIISAPAELTLPIIELPEVAEAERLEAALRLLQTEVLRPYDLMRDTLWRVILVRLREDEHLLLLSLSHLISDAWSMDLLVREALVLYRAFASGRPSPLAEPPIQFADYAHWQRRTLQGQGLEKLRDYWQRQLEGIRLIPEVHLPIERPLPAGGGSQTGAAQSLNVSADLLEALRELSSRQQVTLYMLLIAALFTLLHRYTGKNDFGILTPSANRHRPETTEVIGRFADNIVLRIRLTGVETFSDLLHRVRSVVSEAFEHQDLPFALYPGNTPEVWQDLDYPTFGFNMLAKTEGLAQAAQENPEVAHMPRLRVEMMSLPQHRRESIKTVGIDLGVMEKKADLYMNLSYECERYEDSAIKELLDNYRLILETVITDPERRLLDFPLTTPTSL